ncbi:hypothetical protein GCM10010271_70260 [Streptomyces kurssanovii]|nr:hypothetical protein GCM10010271_70260 [Streptomyces kurssanovii]
MTITLAVGTACTPVASYGSAETGPPDKEATTATLRERLAAFEKPLPRDGAQRAYQELADAMAAASDAGMGQEAMLGEVLASQARQWKEPGGMEAFQANNAALDGHAATLPPPPGKSDQKRGSANGPQPARFGPPAQATQPQVKNFFVNGVYNNSGPDLDQAGTALRDTLGVGIDPVYNRSFTEANWSVRAGQAKARSPEVMKDKNEAQRMLLENLSGPFFRGAVGVVAAGDLLRNSIPKTIDKWRTPEAARDSAAYVTLKKLATDQLNAGTRVVFACHSEGCLIGRQLKLDLDAQMKVAPGRSPIGAVYIAPAFKFDDPDSAARSLNSNDTRYILLKDDVLSVTGATNLPHTAEPTADQPAGKLNAVGIHLLNNYTRQGTASRQQIIDAYKGVTDYIRTCPVPGGLKYKPGRQQECPPAERPEQPPEQPPGEQPPAQPEQPPAEPPTDSPAQPEQPPGEQPPAQPEQPPEQPPAEPPPAEPPTEPPAQPEQPPAEPPPPPHQP